MPITATSFQSVLDVLKKWHRKTFKERLVYGQPALEDVEYGSLYFSKPQYEFQTCGTLHCHYLRFEESQIQLMQTRLLRAVIDRCLLDEREFRFWTIPSRTLTPMQACLLVPPGTGKTQCFLWIIDFFAKVCKWEMGVQFQMTASQNTMAAAIQGDTNHSWGEVPINAVDGDSTMKKNAD